MKFSVPCQRLATTPRLSVPRECGDPPRRRRLPRLLSRHGQSCDCCGKQKPLLLPNRCRSRHPPLRLHRERSLLLRSPGSRGSRSRERVRRCASLHLGIHARSVLETSGKIVPSDPGRLVVTGREIVPSARGRRGTIGHNVPDRRVPDHREATGQSVQDRRGTIGLPGLARRVQGLHVRDHPDRVRPAPVGLHVSVGLAVDRPIPALPARALRVPAGRPGLEAHVKADLPARADSAFTDCRADQNAGNGAIPRLS
jgi:hypothetical protein